MLRGVVSALNKCWDKCCDRLIGALLVSTDFLSQNVTYRYAIYNKLKFQKRFYVIVNLVKFLGILFSKILLNLCGAIAFFLWNKNSQIKNTQYIDIKDNENCYG